MEQDQQTSPLSTSQKSSARQPPRYSPLNSPQSLLTSSTATTPATPRIPQLSVAIPKTNDVDSPAEDKEKPSLEDDDEDDRRYWDEEDEGYWGELEEDEDEDLEECYRSVH